MAGNKWQELNSSTTRIGQTPGTAPPAGPAPQKKPKNSDEQAAAGLSAGVKAGVAAAALAVLGIGGLIAISGSGSDDPQQNQSLTATPTTISDTLPFGSETTEETPAEEDASGVRPAVIGADSPPSPPEAPEGHSILANGKIYLRGTVPSVQVEGFIVVAVEEVLGEGNVVAEYTIDPSVPFNPGDARPVYVADTVLFATGSAEIAPDFYPLLGLGLTLMQVQPNVVVEVIGHTDSLGDDADNLALSQARVDAVQAWMLAQGADGTRLSAVGRGETSPRADNETPEGRQANRRVEFIISGFEF